MSQHATAEVLSAYVDDELEPRFKLRLVEHLEECEECREQLAGLRRVVGTLQRLERAAPPPLLAGQVQRHISLAPRQSANLIDRLESRLKATPQGSPLFFTFALVACLAVVLYLFAHGVERSQTPRTSLIVGTLPQAPVPTGEIVETRMLDGRTYELVDGLWRQQGITQRGADLRLEATTEEALRLRALHPGLETLGDRVLLQVEEMIVEIHGLSQPAPAP